MSAVAAGSLALMDAGVPISQPAAGVTVGLLLLDPVAGDAGIAGNTGSAGDAGIAGHLASEDDGDSVRGAGGRHASGGGAGAGAGGAGGGGAPGCGCRRS